jgi:DNA repair protein RadA/Sms
VLAETNAEAICNEAAKLKPAVLIVDSIQTSFLPGLESAPGSVSQVRESAAYLTRFAKQTGTVLVLVGPRDQGRRAGRPESARTHD